MIRTIQTSTWAAPRAQLIRGVARRQRVAVFGWLSVYVVVLTVVYQRSIAPGFGYEHLTYSQPPIGAFAICLLMLGVCAAQLPVRIRRPSQVVYWLLFILVVLPTLLVPLYARTGFDGDVSIILRYGAALTACFCGLGLIYRGPIFRPRNLVSHERFWPILAGTAVALHVVIIAANGLHFSIVGFGDVYKRRAEFSEVVSTSAAVGYATTWLGNILNPIIIARGISERRRAWLIGGVTGQCIIYSVTAFKSVALSALPIAGILWLLKDGRRYKFGANLFCSVIFIVVLSSLADKAFGTLFYSGTITRRIFVSPGLLSGLYSTYFSAHPHDHLAHSILSPILTSPNHSSIAVTIGRVYYAGSPDSANANIWADAFANFGYPGMFIFTGLLAMFFSLYDSLSRSRGLRFMSVILAVPAITLSNTGLLTALMTHGLGIALLVAWAIPASRAETLPTTTTRSSTERRRSRVRARREGSGPPTGALPLNKPLQ